MSWCIVYSCEWIEAWIVRLLIGFFLAFCNLIGKSIGMLSFTCLSCVLVNELNRIELFAVNWCDGLFIAGWGRWRKTWTCSWLLLLCQAVKKTAPKTDGWLVGLHCSSCSSRCRFWWLHCSDIVFENSLLDRIGLLLVEKKGC